MSVYQEAASGKGHVAGTLALTLQQPAGVKAPGITADSLASNRCSPVIRQLEEAVVGPDDVAALRTENDHG